MSAYVLDTDTTTLLLRGHAAVCKRAGEQAPDSLVITIVTVEEILTGWYGQIRRATKDDQLLRAYTALQQAVEFIARIRILPLDALALQKFHDLKSGKFRLGTNDLRIAAIVQAQDATLVTCNLSDFKRLPSIKLEDWSQPQP